MWAGEAKIGLDLLELLKLKAKNDRKKRREQGREQFLTNPHQFVKKLLEEQRIK